MKIFMTTACPSILPFQFIIYNIFEHQQQQKNSRDIINLKREYYLIQIVQNKGKANRESEEKKISKIIAVFDPNDSLVEKIERNLNYSFLVG